MKNLKAKTISVLLTFMAFSNSLIISNAIENKLDTINDEEQNLELIQDTTNEDSEQIINDTNNIEDTSTLSTTSSKELEVKNTISQATTITIGKTYTGKTNGNNYNYYKFTVAQDGYIDINFKENQNVRFDFKLEDNSQKSHGTWSTNYGSGTKTVRMGLAKGTYYLRISKYSTSNPNTQYSFSVNATASNYWEKEFNNSYESSNNITIGNTYNGITDTSGYDYYKFTISKDGYIDINFKESQDVKFDFKLEDESRRSHGMWSTHYGSGTTKVRMGLAKGTYYLRVSKYSTSNQNTQYSFSVNLTASNYWEKEFNNSYQSSNNIIVGKTYNGITDTNGYDYYKFTLAKDADIDINFDQNQNVRFDFKIEDESRKSYGMWSTHYGSGTNVQKVSLKKGTYYLRVSKYSTSNQNTQYSFSVGSPSVKKSKLIGDDRYKTAIKVSNRGWTKADNVVLVNSSAIVDALSATPFAKMKNAPILLTEKDKLNEDTKKEITRLCAKNVYVIGGTSIISGNIVSELKSMNLKVERISGDTRYTTSLAIAKKLGTVSEIAVVNGVTGLADAVSIAPVAASKKMPIILASPDTGTKAFDEYIKSNNIKTSYVIGGENAISKDVASKLPNVKRLGGSSRNETNALILEKFYTNKDLNNVFVAKDGMAKANDLIDALAVGVLAAKENSPLVIVGNQLDAKQEKVLLTKKPKEATQVGGNGNENVYNQIINLY